MNNVKTLGLVLLLALPGAKAFAGAEEETARTERQLEKDVRQAEAERASVERQLEKDVRQAEAERASVERQLERDVRQAEEETARTVLP
jgi:predicted phage-related endonuclease